MEISPTGVVHSEDVVLDVEPAALTYRANFSQVRRIDVSERGSFFVLALDDGRFIKVSDDVKEIIEHLVGEENDGDPERIAARLRDAGTADHSAAEVQELIDSVLLPQQIVLPSDEPVQHAVDNLKSRLWVHFKLFDGRSLEKMSKFTNVLFTRPAVLVALATWFTASLALILSGGLDVLFSTDSYQFNFQNFLLLVVPGAIIHELGHALSCYRFGVRARDMGAGLYLFRPVLFTDMSEAWLLDRKTRVLTDLAGCYFGWLYIIGLTTAAIFVHEPLLLWTIFILYLANMGNLNPFIRFDGYWVLTDLTGVVNVHQRAIALLFYRVQRLIGRKVEKPPMPLLSPMVRWVLTGLSCLYIVFTTLLLYLGFRTLGNLFLDPELRSAFLTPFAEAIRERSLFGFLQALRSGGLISIMLFYLLLMILSTLSGLIAGLARGFSRNRKRKREAANDANEDGAAPEQPEMEESPDTPASV